MKPPTTDPHSGEEFGCPWPYTSGPMRYNLYTMGVNEKAQHKPPPLAPAGIQSNHVAAEGLTGAPEVTIVIPTYNEVENVPVVYQKLVDALERINWEVIFVDDDSPDGTSGIARKLALADSRVRVIQRVGRRGLASACIEGMLASASPYIAVMDGDLQHDETILPAMLNALKKDNADIVVASRSIEQGSFGSLPDNRIKISRLATWMTKLITKVPLSDPMSGFFMLRRTLVEDVFRRLYGQGFKILLDICANASGQLKIVEIPYSMRYRYKGESKLNTLVVLEFLAFLATKLVGRLMPVEMIKFFMVGLTGVAVHMTVLGIAYRLFEFEFFIAQVIATCVAIASNFVLNNRYTFRAQRLYGRAFWSGLASFYVVCAFGAVIALAVGEYLYRIPITWWLAGFATTILAALWNYGVSSVVTWRSSTRST